MATYGLAFDSPWYLALLVLVPLIWAVSRRSLSGLGRVRRLLAIGVRCLVLVLLILALAEIQSVHTNSGVTVTYLLDQSHSISADQTEAMLKYVSASIRAHDPGQQDRAAVIVFGREAAIELPPSAENAPLSRLETVVDREYTNLADAMKLAEASFPHDSARRVVVVSDFNENVGDAMSQGRALADAGIGIDVLPLRSTARGDVAVEKLAIPSDVRSGQPFDVKVAVSYTPPAGSVAPIRGRLKILKKSRLQEALISDEAIELAPGKRILTAREQIDEPEFYTYEARFAADRAQDDAIPQNNVATTFVDVRGNGQVLLIEDHENPGEFTDFVARLRSANLEVTVRSTSPEELFNDLADLQSFDTVILANVPREPFSDAQIQALVRNTQHLGSGLVMLGGPNSFGAGGWTGTALEGAMPVDFQIKNTRVSPTGALALVLDTSGSMAGQKLAMCKAAAIAAAEVLGKSDYIGVVCFDTDAHWLVPLQKAENIDRIAARIRSMGAAGGTNMYPGMEEGYAALQKANAAIKHVVLLTDGQTQGSGFVKLTADMRSNRITTSCVAVGQDAADRLLKSIAGAGGGKFYHVDSPRAIPKIFMKEARQVSRPLLFETPSGMQPRIVLAHEMLQGIDALPPIKGFVLTTLKQSPLVEAVIVSPQPVDEKSNTILAGWTYGLGRAVAFTSDAGRRWSADWTGWSGYEKLFSQIVRWSMRPAGDQGKYTLATDVQQGAVRLTVTALDQGDRFMNFLKLGGIVVGPDMKAVEVGFTQVAPGRYVGQFDAKARGSYFLTVNPGTGRAPVRAGVNVSYSDEFRERDTNEPLMQSLAALVPKQGVSGKVIEAGAELKTDDERLASLLKTDPFRRDLPKHESSQPIWHLLVLLAGCLFFCDVLVRRVSVSFAWAGPFAVKMSQAVLRRTSQPAPTVTLERLRGKKEEISGQLRERGAAARIASAADGERAGPKQFSTLQQREAADGEAKSAGPPRTTPPDALRPATADAPPESETYTGRLLRAKRKVWTRPDGAKEEPPG